MTKKKSAKNKAKTKPVVDQATLIEESTIVPETENIQEDAELVNASEETLELSEIPDNIEEYVEIEPTELIQAISPENVIELQTENIEADNAVIEVVAENAVELEATSLIENNVVKEEVVAEAQTNKSSKKKASDDTTKAKRVKFVGTSYHYFRNWLKQLFRENGIQSAKFIKNAEGWLGHISILDSDKEPAIQVLNKYQVDNPDTKSLWWDVNAK